MITANLDINKKSPAKALVMAFADISGNPRPRRIVRLLQKQGFEVSVACFELKGDLDVSRNFVIGSPSTTMSMRILRKIINAMNNFLVVPWLKDLQDHLCWGISHVAPVLKNENFDLIVVEDLYLLPLAFRIKNDAKVLFDAREYYPSQYDHSLLWRLTEKRQRIRLCKYFLPKCDAMITVSEGIRREYKKNFDVNPVIVRSLPFYNDINPVPNTRKIRMVHHGVANRNRKLEHMIKMFSWLDGKFELDLYLVGNKPYVDKLRKMAEGISGIQFKDPVPFKEIIPTFNKYDIGLCFLEATTFNLKYSLPNKFFEYVQSRLMLVVGPSPDMVDIVSRHNLGIVVPEFSPRALANALNLLTREDIEKYKAASSIAARELCYEKESDKVLSILEQFGFAQTGFRHETGLSDT